MEFRYYKNAPVNHHVWFKLIGAGELVEDFADAACFGVITHGFDHRADMVQVYHQKHWIPYDRTSIERWINDINEMGFPCFFKEDEDPIFLKVGSYLRETINDGVEDTALMLLRHGEPLPKSYHNFFVSLHEYKDKNHFFSTLSLIRCLIQSGINRVPEEYFKLMDETPSRDKFEAMQTAHRIVSCKNTPYDPKTYAPTGHMVTFDGNGQNITKDALMARFAKMKTDLRDRGYLRIHANWNGTNDEVWKVKDF